MEFGNQSIPMPAHDNSRGGLAVEVGPEPKALSAGRSVGKRHGKACEQHDMSDKESIISKTGLISTDEKDSQKSI